MQFLKLSHEIITDKNITSNEFRIYTYLLSLYNEEKQCSFPSIETISKNINISVATVKKGIKRLSELKYISIEKRQGASGNFNTYKNFKHLIDKISPKKTNNKEDNQSVNEESEVKNEAIKPIIVSDCKESGLQITIDEVEEIKFKASVNASKIAKKFEKSKNFKLTKWFLDRIAKIDETIVDIVLEEKPKTAKLFLIKCIEKTLLAGLELAPIIKNTLRKYAKIDIDYANALATKYESSFYMAYAEKQLAWRY